MRQVENRCLASEQTPNTNPDILFFYVSIRPMYSPEIPVHSCNSEVNRAAADLRLMGNDIETLHVNY